MNDDFASPEQLHELQRKIDTWLGKRLREDLVIESSDFDAEESRWYVRITGEEKKNYIQELIKADMEEAGQEDVFRKIKQDFEKASISVEDSEIRNQLEKALLRAKEDFK